MRMSRAGRQKDMLKVVARHDSLYPTGCLTTAQIAHRVGLKSSTNVVNMLRELAQRELVQEVFIEPKYGAGYTVRAWKLCKQFQMELPTDYILINGKSYRKVDGVEAEYVHL